MNTGDRRVIILVFLASLLIHGFLLFKGANASTDYRLIYDPAARQLLEWFKGSGGLPPFSGYQLFHSAYVFFIAVIYLCFGAGNLFAVAAVQAFLSTAVFILLFRFIFPMHSYPWTAVLACLVSLTFIDNISWTVWAVPDSAYRFLYVCVFICLIGLYQKGKTGTMAITAAVSFLVMTLFRLDTVIYFLPFFALIAVKKWGIRRGLTYCALGTVCCACLGILFLGNLRVIAVDWVKGFYVKGYVVQGMDYHIPGVTIIAPFDYARTGDLMYLIARGIKLIFMRLFETLNPFPVYWSLPHKLVYSAYILPIYVFAGFGLSKAFRNRSIVLILLAYPYLAYIMLYVLVSVDASKRASFTPLPFLIALAGIGLDNLVHNLKQKKAL